METSFFTKKMNEFGDQFNNKKFYTGQRSALIFHIVNVLTNNELNELFNRLVSNNRYAPNVDEFKIGVNNILARRETSTVTDVEVLKDKATAEIQRDKFFKLESKLISEIGKEKYYETLKKIHNRTNIFFSFESEFFRRMIIVELDKNKNDWGKTLASLQNEHGSVKTPQLNNLNFS